MGNEFEVNVLPIQSTALDELKNDAEFMLAAYSVIIVNDPEKNTVWEIFITH